MIMKIKDVFQRKWITDSITKRRYPFQIPSMTGRLHIYPNFRKRMKSEIAMHLMFSTYVLEVLIHFAAIEMYLKILVSGKSLTESKIQG